MRAASLGVALQQVVNTIEAIPMDSSPCAVVEALYDLIPLHALQWFYLVSSIVSVALILHIAFRYLHRTIFENVTKELIISLFAFIALYSICLASMQGSQLTYRYIAKEKCEAQGFCVLRYLVTVVVVSFIVLHIGITLQHFLSTFHFTMRTQTIVARLSIALAFLYPIVLGFLAYGKDSLEGTTAYCSGFTAHSTDILMPDLWLLIFLDVGNTIASVVLWKYNDYRFKKNTSFDLSLSFHRRQNLFAMQQFLPIAILHAVIYTIFFMVVSISQALRSSFSPAWYTFISALANVIPHYCYLCPLLLLILIRRGRFKRTSQVTNLLNQQQIANEQYFADLRNLWGSLPRAQNLPPL